MTHAEFVAAYREGRLTVQVDRAAAARFVSQRMLLPFFLLPVLGLAVALALTGWVVTGIALFLGAIGFRYIVRASGRGFVLSRALRDAQFYEQARAAGLIQSLDSS
jgi:predicted membrane-bound spermidine synthase